MRLSDSYVHEEESYSLELICTVYNINPGNNLSMMKDSMALQGYMTFVEKVRSVVDRGKDIREAVEEGINFCIDNDVLKEFFSNRRTEVTNKAMLDFRFEKRLEYARRDSLQEGIEQGIQQGIQQGFDCAMNVLQRLQNGATDDQLLAEGYSQELIDKARKFV